MIFPNLSTGDLNSSRVLLVLKILKDSIPYASQILTVAIAVVAILMTRRSSKETVGSQLEQKMWDKRTETYIDIIKEVTRLDPRRSPTAEGFIDKAAEADGESVDFLPVDRHSEEWRNFEARVEALASPEVRFLYWLWDATVAGWTWRMSKVIIHESIPDSEYQEEAHRELQETYEAVYSSQKELFAQIRAELRFERRELRGIEVERPEGYMGAVTRLDIDWSRHEQPAVVRASRLMTIRQTPGGWQHEMELGDS